MKIPLDIVFTHGLGPREVDFLEMICDGKTPKEIAVEHGIRLESVQSSLSTARQKIGIFSKNLPKGTNLAEKVREFFGVSQKPVEVKTEPPVQRPEPRLTRAAFDTPVQLTSTEPSKPVARPRARSLRIIDLGKEVTLDLDDQKFADIVKRELENSGPARELNSIISMAVRGSLLNRSQMPTFKIEIAV